SRELAEDDGDPCHRAGTADPHLDPDLEEGPEGPECLMDDVVAGARPGEERRQLGEGQGSTKRDGTAQSPEEVDLPGRLGDRRQLSGREKDAGAENVPSDQGPDGPEA